MKQLQEAYLYNVDPKNRYISFLFPDDGLYLVSYTPSEPVDFQTDEYYPYGGKCVSKAYFNEDGELESKTIEFGESVSDSEYEKYLNESKKLMYYKYDLDILLERYSYKLSLEDVGLY
ncbi:hypothetical protein UFOVP695_26 [uncultured Caudovirales phage]|uniref:Uncharacterized protein n=1 Tax=uncultured Caudovirales phage TaxID=2100421 RepID=A0A6J5NSK9_9CAUD|nr:hypothetical protein UFOVP695_26 [uncultured Caudovirales phage]